MRKYTVEVLVGDYWIPTHADVSKSAAERIKRSHRDKYPKAFVRARECKWKAYA